MQLSIPTPKAGIQTVFWLQPYEVRRVVWRLARPGWYRQAMPWRRDGDPLGRLCAFQNYKCIFVHIPKSGGQSVSQSVFGMRFTTHMTLRNLSLVFSEQEFRSYFKFAFVRNPWDRLYSAFSYLQGGGGTGDINRDWAKSKWAGIDDFETFVTECLPEINLERSFAHLSPQYKFVRLRGLKPAVDFLGRYESLADDFEIVRKRLGINSPLIHINASARVRDYRSVYTDKMIEIVARKYRTDIEVFQYDFDNRRIPSSTEPLASAYAR